MRLSTRCTALFYIFLSLTFGIPATSWSVEDAIIAIVNEELITLKDLKDYAQSTYVGLVAEGLDDAQIKDVMKDMEESGINKLIEDKLILSQAKIIGIDVREAIIDERVDGVRKKYGGEQELVKALIKNGATLTDLRNKIRDQLKTNFIVDHEVKSKIYVNPQEVTKYYEENKNQYSKEESIELESIFISYSSNKKDALRKAVEAFKYAVGGKDFRELNKIYSDTPSVGTIERGQLLPIIEETVFNLEVNEISHLIEVGNGLYIFKLAGEQPSQIASLEEVKDSIYNKLFKEKFKSEFIRWLENLKKDAYIEIK